MPRDFDARDCKVQLQIQAILTEAKMQGEKSLRTNDSWLQPSTLNFEMCVRYEYEKELREKLCWKHITFEQTMPLQSWGHFDENFFETPLKQIQNPRMW